VLRDWFWILAFLPMWGIVGALLIGAADLAYKWGLKIQIPHEIIAVVSLAGAVLALLGLEGLLGLAG
jgi:uncharacterized membrane protein